MVTEGEYTNEDYARGFTLGAGTYIMECREPGNDNTAYVPLRDFRPPCAHLVMNGNRICKDLEDNMPEGVDLGDHYAIKVMVVSHWDVVSRIWQNGWPIRDPWLESEGYAVGADWHCKKADGTETVCMGFGFDNSTVGSETWDTGGSKYMYNSPIGAAVGIAPWDPHKLDPTGTYEVGDNGTTCFLIDHWLDGVTWTNTSVTPNEIVWSQSGVSGAGTINCGPLASGGTAHPSLQPTRACYARPENYLATYFGIENCSSSNTADGCWDVRLDAWDDGHPEHRGPLTTYAYGYLTLTDYTIGDQATGIGGCCIE